MCNARTSHMGYTAIEEYPLSPHIAVFSFYLVRFLPVCGVANDCWKNTRWSRLLVKTLNQLFLLPERPGYCSLDQHALLRLALLLG